MNLARTLSQERRGPWTLSCAAQQAAGPVKPVCQALPCVEGTERYVRVAVAELSPVGKARERRGGAEGRSKQELDAKGWKGPPDPGTRG